MEKRFQEEEDFEPTGSQEFPIAGSYDEANSLFTDEEVYSWYVAESPTGITSFTPELRLRVAVLGDALWCLQQSGKSKNGKRDHNACTDKEAARQWLMGEVKSMPSFSFQAICDSLGLDVGATRKAILKMLKTRRFDVRELIFWLR